MTNYNRSCLFGPSIPPSFVRDCGFSWTRLNKESSADISGIFYDYISLGHVSAMGPINGIANIGITQDIINPGRSFPDQELPRIPVASRRPEMTEIGTGFYLSIGNLSLIQSLRVRKIGQQFTGLSISHDDGSIDVLGRWDDRKKSAISEIYNSSNGVLTSIIFRFHRESEYASYVDGIFVEVNGEDSVEDWDTGTFKTFSINQVNSVCHPCISTEYCWSNLS